MSWERVATWTVLPRLTRPEVAGGAHLQVLFDAAGQGADLAVAEEGDLVVGDALEEVAVV